MLRGMKTLFALAPLLIAATPLPADSANTAAIEARVNRVLARTPLIDGHNDWAEALREREGEGRWTIDMTQGLDRAAKPYSTDIARLRRGRVGGQFWSVWVDPALPGDEQVVQTIEQIGLVHNMVRRYPDVFELASTAADVRRIHKSGRIASMIGVEGGGQIAERFAVLRAYRRLGASYLTLTHTRGISWADSATDAPRHGGLTAFGEQVVREINRTGMLVDLSHVSEATMLDALRVTRAPVIFSHSNARALCDHPRNVPDAVLGQLKTNGGVVMVAFYPPYLSEANRRWSADRVAEQARLNTPPYNGLFIGQPDKAAAALAAWDAAHPAPAVGIGVVADHIEHIARVAGVDHVGLGSDFDGIGATVTDLDDVGDYPALLAELARRGWSDADLAKLAGGNVLRVMERAERVAVAMKDEPAATQTVEVMDAPTP